MCLQGSQTAGHGQSILADRFQMIVFVVMAMVSRYLRYFWLKILEKLVIAQKAYCYFVAAQEMMCACKVVTFAKYL